jgi:5,6,7,8-tetrahydromethanopterin hydro-lyase
MTWGPAQAGVAGGVAEAVAREIVFDIDDVLIAAVWVDPAADDPEAVFANNLEATVGALAMGQQGLPTATEVEESRTDVWNPFFRAP